MKHIAFYLITVLIAIGIAISVFMQAVALPGMAADEVALFPAYEPYRVPLLVTAIAFLVCAQISLIALWVLLLRAHQGVFFRPGTQSWVTTIGVCISVATLLTLGLFIFLTFFEFPTRDDGMDSLGLWMAGGLGFLIGAAVLIVVFVARRLIDRAIAAHIELDGVL